MTPWELQQMCRARDERTRDAWFRTSWLAVAVRSTIWAQHGPTPHQLLGWDDPAAEARIRAFWSALKARQGPPKGH